MSLGEFAESLRVSRSSVAVGALTADAVEFAVANGRQTVDGHTLFDVGSISKTLTATILAELILAGTLRLDSTVGELLPITSGAAAVTLGQLATHTSGLPRLAPNYDRRPFTARDPYASWDVPDLLSGLERLSPEPSEDEAYSNFGYQVLGQVLTVAAGASLPALTVALLHRAGCTEVRCGDEGSKAATVRGYAGLLPVRTWSMRVYGAGGLRMSITALMRWAAVQTRPERSPIEAAVRLTQRPVHGDLEKGHGLGWALSKGRVWHNGGTAGHRAELFIRPGVAAVGAVTNNGKAEMQRLVAGRLPGAPA